MSQKYDFLSYHAMPFANDVKILTARRRENAVPPKTYSHVLHSAVGWIKFLPCCTVFSHGPMRNVGFLGSGGGARMPARSACLVTLSPSEAWTWTLRRPDVRHKHLPCHAVTSFCMRSDHKLK